eukprot:403367462
MYENIQLTDLQKQHVQNILPSLLDPRKSRFNNNPNNISSPQNNQQFYDEKLMFRNDSKSPQNISEKLQKFQNNTVNTNASTQNYNKRSIDLSAININSQMRMAQLNQESKDQLNAPMMLDSFDSSDPRYTLIDYNKFKHKGNNQANLNIKRALGDISKKRKEISEINSNRSHIQTIIQQNKQNTSDLLSNSMISNVFDDKQDELNKIIKKRFHQFQSQITSPISMKHQSNGVFSFRQKKQSANQSIHVNSSQQLSENQRIQQLEEQFLSRKIRVKGGNYTSQLPSARQSQDSNKFHSSTIQNGGGSTAIKQINSVRNSLDKKQNLNAFWNQQVKPAVQNLNNMFKNDVDLVLQDDTLLKGYKHVTNSNNKFQKERFSIYQQDFEVKVNKMNNHLDSELKSLSKSVNSTNVANMAASIQIRHQDQQIDQSYAKKDSPQQLLQHINPTIRIQNSGVSKFKPSQRNIKVDDSTQQSNFQLNQNLDQEHDVRDMAELTFGNLSKYSMTNVIPNNDSFEIQRQESFNTEAEFVKDGIHEDDSINDTTESKIHLSPDYKAHIQDQEFQHKIRQMIQEFHMQKEYYSFDQYSRKSNSPSPQFEVLNKAEKLDQDPNFHYFIQCNKDNVLALPALSKIQNKQLVLLGYPLNKGLARGIKQFLKHYKTCITKLALDNNGLQDTWMRQILKGIFYQDDFKQIILCRNTIGQGATEVLCNILKRTFPRNLEDLKITNCKIISSQTFQILKSIKENSYLRKLSLVKASLSDHCISMLCQILQSSRHLIDLDISWNSLRPQNLKEFWIALGKNRTLEYLNLSWNNLLSSSSTQNLEYVDLFKSNMTRFIKYNQNLLHLDLSFTRLDSQTIQEIGTSLRKAKSLLVLHLSGNPGITQELQTYLFDRIHAKINRTYDASIEYSISSHQIMNSPRSSQVIDGVLMKQLTQRKNVIDSTNLQHVNPPLENQKLIFQRYLGHKEDIPGIGQWQMLTSQNPNDSPACCECWVCNKYIYTLIFWSKCIEYQLNDDYHQNEIDQLLKLSPAKISESPIPQILGGFNQWHAQQMIPLHDFCHYLDPQQNNALKSLKKLGKIKEDINHYSQLNQKDQALYHQTQQEINQDYQCHWKEYVTKNLKYKKAQFINNQLLDNVDLKSEQIYVYPTFMRPGRNVFLVKTQDELSNFHLLKCISPLREEEIPIFIKGSKIKVQQRVFKKDNSVFKDWKEDTPQTINQMLDDDMKYWKCHRFIKEENDKIACEKIIRQNAVLLKKIFMTEVCNSGFPNISWIDFSNYCEKCKIFDKNILLSTIDRIFIATNVELEKNDDNPDKALQRYEFYEILVRIAQSKFKDPGICPTYAEGLNKLLNEHIFPYSKPDPWQEFRDEELWTMDVNDVMEANLEGIKKVYSFYWEPRKKFMTQADTMNLMLRDSALGLIDKEANYCYGMCKMSVILESVDCWQYKQLKFVEFLELIGRISVLKFKNTDNESLPLAKKIEFILDILLRMVEVQRKDVNIQVNEESESDDEY